MFRVDTLWGLAALCVIVVVCLTLGFELRNRLDEGPAIVVSDETHMVGQAEAGGTLYLSVYRKQVHARPPVCDGSTDRILWRWKQTAEGGWEREISPFSYRGIADPFNESEFQLDLKIDAEVAPGVYWFTFFLYEPCDLLIRLGFVRQKIYPSGNTKVIVSRSATGETISNADTGDIYPLPPGISLDPHTPVARLDPPVSPAPGIDLDFAARAKTLLSPMQVLSKTHPKDDP